MPKRSTRTEANRNFQFNNAKILGSGEAPKTRIVNHHVESDVRLDGKTVIVTGANSGIGFETALDLARRGARTIMACRDMTRAEAAKVKILQELSNDVEIVIKMLDLSSMESIRECAKDINETESRLDILINNAGIMACPKRETKDGFEMQFGVNHLGHFLFTNLLLDLLKKSAPSRIVILSSSAHKLGSINWNDMMMTRNYEPMKAYCNSKICNILHGKELARRLQGTGVTTYIVHPGYIFTDLQRYTENDRSHLGCFASLTHQCFFCFCKWQFIPVRQGAQTTLFCAISPELADETGNYYADCKKINSIRFTRSEENAKKLWQMSEEWTSVSKQEQHS